MRNVAHVVNDHDFTTPILYFVKIMVNVDGKKPTVFNVYISYMIEKRTRDPSALTFT